MLLDSISKGTIDKPPRIMVYGQPGVGKSQFASGAPNTLFIDSERRTEHLDVNRLEVTTWGEIMNASAELYTLKEKGECDYTTVVYDTLDHMELLLHKMLCKKSCVESIEEIGGGWGKGYTEALEHWEKFNRGLEALREVGFTIVLLAHSQIRMFKNPEGEDYDKYMLKLHQKAANFLIAEMDYVGFATFEDVVLEERFKKAKGKTTGERILKFVHSAAYDSKAGRPITDVIPLDWDAFITATKENTDGENH
jgi:hypothetical protein